MAPWCSWLARKPVTLEVRGSSPLGVAIAADIEVKNSVHKSLQNMGWHPYGTRVSLFYCSIYARVAQLVRAMAS